MKLLLIAAMFGSAFGACATWASGAAGQTDGYTCTGVCATAVLGGTVTDGANVVVDPATFGCAAGYTGTAAAATCTGGTGKLVWTGCTVEFACTPNTSTATGCKTCIPIADRVAGAQCASCNAGSFLAAKACAGCTCPTGQETCTCTSATADIVPLTCSTGYQFAEVVGVTAVTAADQICASATDVTPVVNAAAAVAKVDLVTAVPATCTQCAGSQTGCGADTATTCAYPTKTATSTIKLACTTASDGNFKTGTIASACSGTTTGPWTKTWVAGGGACAAATCNTGYKVNTASPVACQENTCKASAVPAAYTATGIVAVTQADQITTVIADKCSDPIKVAVTGVAAVTAVTGIAASLATKGAGLGVVACAATYSGTPAATCPTEAGDFVYTGCTVTASSSAAQTMIACILAVVAMYL